MTDDPRPVMTDPASAIAASRCMAAHVLPDSRRTERTHPRPCGWCDYAVEDLRKLVDGFNDWSDYNARNNTFGHHEIRVWSDLPRAEQERRIVSAQAFPEVVEAPPEPEVAEQPATGWHHEALATADVDRARALDDEPAAEDEQAWLG